MRKTNRLMVAMALASLFVTGAAYAQTPQAVLKLFPTGPNTDAINLINTTTGIKFPDYQYPTATTIARVRALMTALDANDAAAIPTLVSELGMVVDHLDGANSNILYFHVPNRGLEITFFWRVGAMKVPGDPSTYGNPVDPLIFELPHQGQDGTGPAGSAFIQQTHARCMILNACSPHSSPLKSACQIGGNDHISDGAHQWKTLFNQTHIGLALLYPDAFFAQIHGYTGPYLIVYNEFNGEFTTKHVSGDRLFMNACPDNFAESFWSNFAFVTKDTIARDSRVINGSVEANYLNGGNQCYLGNGDSGKFMFAEFGQKFLFPGYKYSSMHLHQASDAFNEMMVKWVGGS